MVEITRRGFLEINKEAFLNRAGSHEQGRINFAT